MNVNLNNIDEIGIFRNDDGKYSVELYMSTTAGEPVIVKIPRSSLEMRLTNSCEGLSMELKLEGLVNVV